MGNETHSARTIPAGIERKLTAILSADVKGYSRLMGADEVATLRTLTTSRKVMDTLIEQHHGRVVGSAGDSVLAEFASVVDAVQCAVVIQTTLKAENANLPPDHRMEFRIGINLGDVMVEGEQIYGDGVNIAARLESLADPGGICISGTVYEHVKNKVTLSYEDLGEQAVKNIAEPVRVFRVLLEPAATATADKSVLRQAQHERESTPLILSPSKGERRVLQARSTLLLACLFLLAATIVAVRYFSHPPFSPQSSSLVTQEAPALPLPDKPSLIVLPFVSMSKDPEQEYFSDGITEDITADLSKISGFFVIARNSAFTYKGKAVKVQEVSREMGVRYVLEGSVRKAGEQVRVTAQLIDGTTGGHVWSARYDRPLRDIFAVQDEIVQQLVTTLRVEVQEAEQERVRRIPTTNLTAYDIYLRGVEYLEPYTKEAIAKARQMFEQVIALDPQYAAAYALLSATYWRESVWNPDPHTLEQALEMAQRAVALNDYWATRWVLGLVYLNKMQYEQALAEIERAVARNPNMAGPYAILADVLSRAGRDDEALRAAEQALRLKPYTADSHLYPVGMVYARVGRHAEAIAPLKQYLTRYPNILGAHLTLAAVYSELGREAEARAEAAEVLRINPNFSLEVHKQRVPIKDPAVLERHLAALRKAGLK